MATLANHAAAGALGGWLTTLLGPEALRWVLGLGFLAMAAWMLVPDTLDAPGEAAARGGAFVATAVAFFLAEMGDKTQIATIGLAARFDGALAAVVAGTTLGMLLANVPAVLAGERLAHRIPTRWVHRAAALLFAVLGSATLPGLGEGWLG